METPVGIQEENLAQRIYLLRGKKVMFDFDLAKLYDLETRVLKQQVRRNMERFPEDFMFELSREEWEQVITNCDNLSVYSRFKPFPPFAFTELGVAMLSSVHNSKKAIMVNIAIMRAFVNLRQLIDTNKDLIRRILRIDFVIVCNSYITLSNLLIFNNIYCQFHAACFNRANCFSSFLIFSSLNFS